MAEPRRTSRRAGAAAEQAGGESLATRLVAHLRKKHGETAAAVLSDGLESTPTDFISSQNLLIDYACDVPGAPVGRIISVVGESSTGKTTLAYHMLAEAQRRKGIGIILDAERSLDLDRARALGIDVDTLVVLQPETVEDCIRQIEEIISSVRSWGDDCLVCIVWDSVGALPTEAEEEAGMDHATMALHARVLSKALRRLGKRVAKHKISLVLINQYRDNVGGNMPGRPTAKTMLAARPVKFYSSIQLEVERIKTELNSKKEPKAIVVRVRNLKNKVGVPFRTVETRIDFEHGLDIFGSLLQQALRAGLVGKQGAWYTFKHQDGTTSKFYAKGWPKILAKDPSLVTTILESSGLEYPPDALLACPLESVAAESLLDTGSTDSDSDDDEDDGDEEHAAVGWGRGSKSSDEEDEDLEALVRGERR